MLNTKVEDIRCTKCGLTHRFMVDRNQKEEFTKFCDRCKEPTKHIILMGVITK